MSCLKIPRRVQIYSFVAFLLSCVFCAFGSSSNVSATSVTCNQDTFNQGSVQFNPICADTSSLDSSKQWFYFLESSLNNDVSGATVVWVTKNASLNGDAPADFRLIYGSLANFPSSFVFSWSSIPNYRTGYIQVQGNASPVRLFNAVLTVTDDLSSGGGSSEPCPVCPVIPDNPYDTKLDNITKAIYVCGSILIMLYFFFCIYKIIVKDGGSR